MRPPADSMPEVEGPAIHRPRHVPEQVSVAETQRRRPTPDQGAGAETNPMVRAGEPLDHKPAVGHLEVVGAIRQPRQEPGHAAKRIRLDVGLDQTKLHAGEYAGNVRVYTGLPTYPVVTLPVTMSVAD